jgi:alkylation response protein AidB-like acyl-CoA dehydrogenase
VKATCLNGVKQFITSGKNGQLASRCIAVTDKGAGKSGMSAFLVPDRYARLRGRAAGGQGRQHSSDTAQIPFEDLPQSRPNT